MISNPRSINRGARPFLAVALLLLLVLRRLTHSLKSLGAQEKPWKLVTWLTWKEKKWNFIFVWKVWLDAFVADDWYVRAVLTVDVIGVERRVIAGDDVGDVPLLRRPSYAPDAASPSTPRAVFGPNGPGDCGGDTTSYSFGSPIGIPSKCNISTACDRSHVAGPCARPSKVSAPPASEMSACASSSLHKHDKHAAAKPRVSA